jgi:hypothetical protein
MQQYASGETVRLGDRVRLDQDGNGLVVCVIDTSEYTPDFPALDWSYLETGVLIQFPVHGLIHYKRIEPDVAFVSRSV